MLNINSAGKKQEGTKTEPQAPSPKQIAEFKLEFEAAQCLKPDNSDTANWAANIFPKYGMEA